MLYSAGLPIHVMARPGGQRKLMGLGAQHVNDGAHDIRELTVVGRDVVSGMVDPANVDLFKGALNRISNVRFWTDTPPFISYDEDDQPYLNDGRGFERVR